MVLEQIAAYWDTRAEGFSVDINEELKDDKTEIFRSYFQKALPGGTELKILDIGCGPGFFTVLLNEMGHEVISADYSEEMLKKTQDNCELHGYKAKVIRADAQKLPFADQTFDFVCSRNLVWNLEQPQKAYEEWMRVLKPGGRLFVFDGNYYLHYYDEKYRKARENRMEQEYHHHRSAGVDPTPINNIARDLPLSRELRPDWDEKVLQKLGMNMLHTERFQDERSGLVHSFVLWSEKEQG